EGGVVDAPSLHRVTPSPPAGLRAALVADVDVALLLHLHLLLAHGPRDVLGVLDLALADAHLLLDHRRLLHAHLLLLDGDADLFAGLEVGPRRGSVSGGVPFDDDLLALNGDVQRLVLGLHLLVHPDLPGLERLLLGPQLLLPDLDPLTARGPRG